MLYYIEYFWSFFACKAKKEKEKEKCPILGLTLFLIFANEVHILTTHMIALSNEQARAFLYWRSLKTKPNLSLSPSYYTHYVLITNAKLPHFAFFLPFLVDHRDIYIVNIYASQPKT